MPTPLDSSKPPPNFVVVTPKPNAAAILSALICSQTLEMRYVRKIRAWEYFYMLGGLYLEGNLPMVCQKIKLKPNHRSQLLTTCMLSKPSRFFADPASLVPNQYQPVLGLDLSAS